MTDKAKIKPEISILLGDKETGVHIFRDRQTGHLHGEANRNDIRAVLPVLDAALEELLKYRENVKMLVDDLNRVEAKFAAEEAAQKRAGLN